MYGFKVRISSSSIFQLGSFVKESVFEGYIEVKLAVRFSMDFADGLISTFLVSHGSFMSSTIVFFDL